MSESNQTGKKKVSKGFIAVIVAVVVLIGGAAAAMMISSSPKVSYFKAEADSINFFIEQLEERYEPELNWHDKTMEEPAEAVIELAANYNAPPADGMAMMDPAQIINNSTLTIAAQSDMDNKEAAASLSANIAGMTIDNINFFATAEEIIVQLPFIDDLLQIKDEEFGALLHELDPENFTGEESLNLESMFENPYGNLSEEDMEHFKTEYFEMIYDELPEDAFTKADETIEVDGESVNAEKLEMKITEEQLKEIIVLVLDKMKNDETLKEMIKEQMTVQQFGGSIVEADIDEMLTDFESSIDQAKEELTDFQIPDGLNSTIWINDSLIVQRDFSIEMGPTKDELVSFTITGNQRFSSTSQMIDYEFAYSDNYDEGSLLFEGDMNWEDNQGSDEITISAEGVSVTYEASETLEDGSRDFERIFSFDDGMAPASLNWNGVANYDNDQMNSEHEISFNSPEISQDMFALQMNINGKVISGVEIPESENVKNLGTMSGEELNNYFEMDVYPAFEEWLYGMLMGGGTGF